MSLKVLPFLEVLADVSGGNRKVPKSQYQKSGRIPVIDQGKEYICGYIDGNDFLFKKDSLPVIIFGDHTRCFKYVDQPFAMGADGVKVLKPLESTHAKYIYHFLKQTRVPDTGYSRHFKYLKRITIPLPLLAEQERIAEVLDMADALREKRRQAIAKLDELVQSVFLDMFGDPVTNSKGWEVDEIRNIGNVVTGSTPPSKLENMFGGDIPFVTPGDLENDEEETKRHVTPEGASRSRLVRKGSALICCIGATIGKMDIAYSDSAFNQQINAIEWGSRIDDLFGIQILRFFKKKIAAWGTSTTLPILKKSSFERIKVPVPPIEIQGQLAQRIAWIQRIKENYRQQREKFETLFASLQQRAFKGEL